MQPRTSCFTDKFPIVIAPFEGHRVSPMVQFCYVEPGLISDLEDFVEYLGNHALIFRRLRQFRLIYIHHQSRFLDSAKDLFRKFAVVGDFLCDSPAELFQLFGLKKMWDEERFSEFTSEGLRELALGRRRFSAPEFECLYQKWLKKKQSNPGKGDYLAEEFVPLDVDLEAFSMPHNYPLTWI